MQFGLLIRGQHPAGDDIQARARDDLEMARRAEQLGFASVARGATTARIRCWGCSKSRSLRRSL